MDTKFLGSSHTKFVYVTKEKGGVVPFLLWPSCWVERKAQGLSVSVLRWSLGWGRLRVHFHWGKRFPPPNPSCALSKSFFVWASKWSRQNIVPAQFSQWLANSEYQDLVKWGGADLHYAKTLLVREYIQAQSPPSSSSQFFSIPQAPRSSSTSENSSSENDTHDASNPLNITWMDKKDPSSQG